jgi:hypothetical protein
MKLSDGGVRRCKLLDVLYVPGLAYNLLSVSKAVESGSMTTLLQMVVRLAEGQHEIHRHFQISREAVSLPHNAALKRKPAKSETY